MSADVKAKAGLEDIVATSSRICFLDGDRGVLAYCGYDIHDLARNATFEETCFLLWHGRLPSRAELGDLQSQLAAARAAARVDHPADEDAAALGRHGRAPDADLGARPLRPGRPRQLAGRRSYRKAVRLTAQIASLVATWGRMQQGGGPIAPDPAMGHAANFLYMLFGDRPNATAIRAMDVALTLHADHELNASTFAARVAAATLTDMHSAIVAGICALKGPLHGGANAEVMKMLIEIGQDAPAERIDAFVKGKFARKEKISGFGHRVYHTEDPARHAPAADVEASSGSRPAISAGSRCRSASRRWSSPRRSSIRTWTSTRRRRTTRWASPSISTRRSSPSAASPAGPRTCSSSSPTIA